MTTKHALVNFKTRVQHTSPWYLTNICVD